MHTVLENLFHFPGCCIFKSTSILFYTFNFNFLSIMFYICTNSLHASQLGTFPKTDPWWASLLFCSLYPALSLYPTNEEKNNFIRLTTNLFESEYKVLIQFLTFQSTCNYNKREDQIDDLPF